MKTNTYKLNVNDADLATMRYGSVRHAILTSLRESGVRTFKLEELRMMGAAAVRYLIGRGYLVKG